MDKEYILSIDVGKGTEDILLWNRNENVENAVQVVSPSCANLMEQRVLRLNAEEPTRKMFFSGSIMGGGPWFRHIYAKSAKYPETVIMEETAAMSMRYDIPYIQKRGVIVVPDGAITSEMIDEAGGVHFKTADILWARLEEIMKFSDISKNDIKKVLFSCQEHGVSTDKEIGVNSFRMKNLYARLAKTGKLETLLMNFADGIPDTMPRFISGCKSILEWCTHLKPEDVFVMDCSPCVVLGAMSHQSEILVNAGNGHTVVLVCGEDGLAEIIYEMHTSALDSKSLEKDLKDLLSGELTHESSLQKGGHGVYIRNQNGLSVNKSLKDMLPITLLGPNREKYTGISHVYAHPIGSMMMAGPYGLIRAYEYHLTNVQK